MGEFQNGAVSQVYDRPWDVMAASLDVYHGNETSVLSNSFFRLIFLRQDKNFFCKCDFPYCHRLGGYCPVRPVFQLHPRGLPGRKAP